MDEVMETKNPIARAVLFPGNWVVDYFKVKEPDNRLLIRMYVNLAVCTKVFGTIAYVWATKSTKFVDTEEFQPKLIR